MTLAEFEQQIFAVAIDSSICDIPNVRHLTSTSISLRVSISSGGFIEAFYNERTGTMALALIREGQRVFGVDNTGGGIWYSAPNQPTREELTLVDLDRPKGFSRPPDQDRLETFWVLC